MQLSPVFVPFRTEQLPPNQLFDPILMDLFFLIMFFVSVFIIV